MSILPTEPQGSKSFSSESTPSPNPNSHHGRRFFTSQSQSESPPSPSRQIHAFGSLQISTSQSPNNSGTSTPGELPQEVTELRTLDVGKILPHQNTNVYSESHSGGRRIGSAQYRGELSGTTVSTRTQNSTGSANIRGSSSNSGGRKAQFISGNHLLNFQYDPISRSQHRGRPQPSRPAPRRPRKIKPYNKDLFLQANYKFVVLDSGNYTPESMDPDKMLQWEDIICLRYSTPSSVQCPICLESPLCAQITSCGHIFCFPCILQYLLMGKEDHRGECWKRCPLCFVMISPKDLYTVYIENVKQYNLGDKIEFMLLARQKDSFLLSHKSKQEKDVQASSSAESYDPFSKFIFTSDVDLSVRKAISDLDGWLVRADSGLVDDLEKLPYVCAAMEQLEQRKKYWDEHRVSDSVKSSKSADYSTGSRAIQAAAVAADSKFEASEFGPGTSSGDVNDLDDDGGTGLSQSPDSLDGQEDVLSSSYDESKGLLEQLNGDKDVKEKDSYNFYQAADGQHIILHPLNMKCLLHHFGSQNMLPDRICGRILQFESVTQSEAIRRRFRFLSHISLTTSFQFCEIDLSQILPPAALLPFMDEIKKREKQRKQVARKERKDKIKAEAAVESPVPSFSSFERSVNDESPFFSMDDFGALGTSTSTITTTSSSPPVVGERKLFSNVTKFGFAAAHDSPGLKIEENNSLHSNQQAMGDVSGVNGSRNANAGTPSFANIMSQAKSGESLEAPRMNELRKKGKKSSRVLLSTAGGRRY
ncbi:hypothetical protein UlMin_013905 [Ulmus minor]